MNLWACEHPGCRVTATGEGGAVGLTAIGWWFQPGPIIFCPWHHPQGRAEASAQADAIQERLKRAAEGSRA